ncbi:hypothetical protein BO71DRAFT_338470 [Aspergillus ellipticus CBS 707.79]|uniref:Geranylgeranyl pyrophosphate synthetase n=1 Tax=Aspergillus ellipticus CBS 707.79 TaxID=1448320 RepID=A0A319CVU9_9EURO|nr:hypothetical protein BO71DRAFT_338470 [Aspergillus ellipticus CBS 707.79]
MWRASSARSRGSSRGPRGLASFRDTQRQPEPVQQSPPPPYGQRLLEIKREELPKAPERPRITACDYVASYTWLGRSTPSIVIPGMRLVDRQGEPPRWSPPNPSRQLPPDRGEYLRDPNAARYPAYPWDPSCQAIWKQQPDFDPDGVDIITCASVLGNLSRFVRGVDRDFRFVMETVGESVFFIRRENSPTDLIPDVRGYGHTFLEEYTSWNRGLPGSESHQRVIRYDFGGLHFLVRFESDGYIPKDDEQPLNEGQKVEPGLETMINTLNLAPPATQGVLHVEEGGRPIAQGEVVDIKTRSMFDFKTRTIKKEIDLTELTPRLWVSQIPTLVVAYHNQGAFADSDIRIRSMRSEIRKWERDHADALRQLVELLQELVGYAQTSATRLEVCHAGSGPLEVRRVGGDCPEALSPEWKAKWIAKGRRPGASGDPNPAGRSAP